MAPDYEYLYNLRFHGKYWHTLDGLLLMGVPVCLALILLWRKAVVPAFLSLIPGLKSRYDIRANPLPTDIILSAVAAFIGGITHIVWDGFTHDDAWPVRAFHVLNNIYLGRPLFSLLQDGSSILGVIFICVKLLQTSRKFAPHLSRREVIRMLLILGVIAVISAIGGVLNALPWLHLQWFVILGQFLIGCMSALVLSLAIFSMVTLVARWWLYQIPQSTKK